MTGLARKILPPTSFDEAMSAWTVLSSHRRSGVFCPMLMALLLEAAVMTPDQGTVRERVCSQRPASRERKSVEMFSITTPHRQNDTGVLLLVNCSKRTIVSVRDPSKSQRHVRKSVYDPTFRIRMGGDSYPYEALNFNEDRKNSSFDLTLYSRFDTWRGPCRYQGLELTTEGADGRELVRFDVDICRTMVLALVVPVLTTAGE